MKQGETSGRPTDADADVTVKVTEPRPLRDLQNFMWNAVSRSLTGNFEMRKRWLDGRDLRQVSEEYVSPSGSLSSFERLEIYNQQYWYRLLDCFEDDFPGLKAVLGNKRFDKLAREYVSGHPSKSFSLRNLGENLVSFLQTRTDLIQPEVVLCQEIARFEWAQVEAFDGERKTPIDQSFLQDKTPFDIILALQPYITLLELNYALDDYSVALTRHNRDRSEAGSTKPREKHEKKAAPQPVPLKNYLVVHRHENTVYFKRVELAAFLILSALSSGRSLNDSITDAVSNLNENGFQSENLESDIQDWFGLWMRLGWLCAP
jgi:hypothetical protein